MIVVFKRSNLHSWGGGGLGRGWIGITQSCGTQYRTRACRRVASLGRVVGSYKESEITIPGDVLVVTAFISYVGCFTKVYRTSLLEKYWIPTIAKLEASWPDGER